MGLQAERWLARYRVEFPNYVDAAVHAKTRISESLGGRPFEIHTISQRAKDPDSVAEKVERKSYGSPARQFDDLLGIRIITLYEHSVPLVAERLRDMFDVDEVRSANKSAALKRNQVGYRSDHLVMKLGKSGLPPVSTILGSTFVEVQVRSVVSHAWAEIEHSLRYKSGIELPSNLSRRFDALAGTLELVDREFSAIEDSLVNMIRDLSNIFVTEKQLSQDLTPISLLAVLPAVRKNMSCLGPKDLVLPLEEAYRLTKLAHAAGLTTVRDVHTVLKQGELRRVVRKYAMDSGTGLDPDNASAVVVMGAVIGLTSRALFDNFQSFQQDPFLISAINGPSI